MSLPTLSISQSIKDYARQLGFDVVGVTDASAFPEVRAVIQERIAQGLLEGIPWFTIEDRIEKGNDPQKLLPGACSIISLGINYYTKGPAPPQEDGVLRGRVSRYAWGDDYHKVIKDKLRLFGEHLLTFGASREGIRVFVDTGPMIDRAAAQRAGLGWYGKNTNILVPGLGSFVFLAQVLTDLELESDKPLKKTCGACNFCMPPCPTGAIVAPHVIDNSKCIAYLTIECRGAIPRHLRPLMGDWVFGCDICQNVCPVNKKYARETKELAFNPRSYEQARPNLLELLGMTEQKFQRRFHNSPIKRAKLVGLQRNACVALGNLGDSRAIPALSRALHSEEPLVRGHAAWALGRIRGKESRTALLLAQETEVYPAVLDEIRCALSEIDEMTGEIENSIDKD